MYTRPASSLAYITVPIGAKFNGVAIDPTADVVQMAFVSEGTEPVEGDYRSGSWETDDSGFEPIYYARCLVGPGGTVTLSAQVWDCYVRITDTTEIPVFSAGQIRLT